MIKGYPFFVLSQHSSLSTAGQLLFRAGFASGADGMKKTVEARHF